VLSNKQFIQQDIQHRNGAFGILLTTQNQQLSCNWIQTKKGYCHENHLPVCFIQIKLSGIVKKIKEYGQKVLKI
jgi:hypothetical protein